MRGLVAVAAVALLLAGCGGSDDTGEDESQPEAASQPAKSLADTIWHGYTKESFPKIYGIAGEDTFAGINDKVVQAAEIVDRKGMCDQVVDASPSQTRSTKGNLVFFVDCADKSRFYISESDMQDGFDTDQKQPGDGDGHATQEQIASCRNQIKEKYSGKGEVDLHTVTGFGSEVGGYGVVSVRQDFTVTDQLGTEQDVTAICRYEGQKVDGSIAFN